MKNISIKQMTTDSILAAMCAVLGAISLDFGNLKVTFESIPIIVGALLFGPADGAIIGFIGTFVYQILRYGVSATTLLWMLPYVVCGVIAGCYSRKKDYEFNVKSMVFIVVLAEIAVTTLNTGVMYIDSKIYGYYSFAYIFGSIVARYIICVVKAIATGAIMPSLISAIRYNVFSLRTKAE